MAGDDDSNDEDTESEDESEDGDSAATDDDLDSNSEDSSDDADTNAVNDSFETVNGLTSNGDDNGNGARGLFGRNKGKYSTAGQGTEDEPYDLVVSVSKASWLSIWALFGVFCSVNTLLLW